MLLAVPATTGEAEESSRSSKQHSSSRSSKQQGSPWRIEVIVVRPLCPDPSVPNVRSVRKCPGLPRVVPLWCPRNPQVSRNNQQCWGSVPRDTGVCVCVTLVLRHLLGQDWLNWGADQQWLRITRNSDLWLRWFCHRGCGQQHRGHYEQERLTHKIWERAVEPILSIS